MHAMPTMIVGRPWAKIAMAVGSGSRQPRERRGSEVVWLGFKVGSTWRSRDRLSLLVPFNALSSA